MELVEKQDQISSFRTAIERGALGTTLRPAHAVHEHTLEPYTRCRRMWLAVLEQCAAEAQGERMWDVDVEDRHEQSRLQQDAAQYLATIGEDLLMLGSLMGLTGEQTKRLVLMRPAELLRNLTVWAEHEAREAAVAAAKDKKRR